MEPTYSADKRTDEKQELRLSIGSAAQQLGISVDTLRRWANEDRVAYSTTLGGQRRFEIAEIERVKAEMSGAQR